MPAAPARLTWPNMQRKTIRGGQAALAGGCKTLMDAASAKVHHGVMDFILAAAAFKRPEERQMKSKRLACLRAQVAVPVPPLHGVAEMRRIILGEHQHHGSGLPRCA